MDRDDVVNDFLGLYVADQMRRTPRSIEEYQERFPGHEDLIAVEHAQLQGAVDSARADRSDPTDGPGTGTVTSAAARALSPPERIGPYRILEALGKGGMGTVYLAEQTAPVRRKVALKVIRPGMDSREVLLRFEAERQALAMMEHDNIAKVLDAGTTEQGRPYFVMEHVSGLPLTDHCDQRRLSTQERLELFIQVCAGVQHAHQRGIIHRDLKPSNILVTEGQGRGTPKIIDFGVAKATEYRLTEATIFTGHGEAIGTPEYMSPEQAGTTAADIDARTDVYSLGVILYELLVGALPFPSTELRGAALAEIQRTVRDTDPPRPSTRLGSLGDSASIARNRRTSPSTLLREIRGDLDWIVMMAMDKDRNRRYGSANELAGDVRRYLGHEPVSAGPPTASYRIRRLLRRYRGQVAAVTAVFLSLVAGTVVFALEGNRALANERTAVLNAEEARREALRARAASEAERAARQAVQANLEKFDLLAGVVNLEVARAAEPDLYPPWPDNVSRIRSWIEERAEPLAQQLPLVERALGELRAKSTLQTDQEAVQARRQDPRGNHLRHLQEKLAAARLAQAVREGAAEPAEFVLPQGLPGDPNTLSALARPLIIPGRDTFGREREGLALARRAWDLSEAADPLARAMIGETLAQALLANGLDRSAIAIFEQVLEAAPPSLVPRYRAALAQFRDLAAYQEDHGREAIDQLAAGISDIEAETFAGRRVFADDSDEFLYDTLEDLAGELRMFLDEESGALARARANLAWAESVYRRSIEAYRERWDAARAAIRAADGVVASELYETVPIELRPQVGLVPIGMNPDTGLWEFYHLRSAADPDVIPEHGPDGSIEVTGDTGIVFVLVPGATVLLGAQKDDPNGPNFDLLIDPDEPLHERTLEPYFIARHEMTQGQWSRLSFGENPSAHRTGMSGHGITFTLAYPIENVNWTMCDELLGRYGLSVPTDSQWEYACRANTDTPWSSGASVESLAGHANLLDETAVHLYPNWGVPEGFDDGFFAVAPVGTFLPNAFGLFDMHGNVWEWCVTDPGEPRRTVQRGASWFKNGRFARSSNRLFEEPGVQANDAGIRPVRKILD